MDYRCFYKKKIYRPGGSSSSSSSTTSESPQLSDSEDSETATWDEVKKESNGDSTDGHSHRFKVTFGHCDTEEFSIDCDQPRTVLEAIKATRVYSRKMKNCSDENIVIQLGKADRDSIVATHFPCTCVREGECLIITCESKMVEEAQEHYYKPIQPRENYSVFYIDTLGGKGTKQKRLFRNRAVKQFKYLCVYGENGMTVEEALKRDGRFIDDLGDFTLSDNRRPNSITDCTQKVDNLEQNEFKIRLPRNKRPNDENQQGSSGASKVLQNRGYKSAALDQRAVRDRVRAAVEKRGSRVNLEENYEQLCQLFPSLKELMESRFPGHSFQRKLNLTKENFGKIQQSFSEVHRVRKLLKLGESVCKVVVENVCVGTGFVLFDNFILTNGHLFKECVEGQQLRDDINVFAIFNYEDPEPHTNYHYFQLAHRNIFYRLGEIDYAILELNPEGHKSNPTTRKKFSVPPGLLNKFGPIPKNGEACIIGHPAGGVKIMDPVCIIEKENRVQAVNDHLDQYKHHPITYLSISHHIKKQGIENIMEGGNRADEVGTYNTCMYKGASGSPAFDAHGRVFGLHTGGFTYGFGNEKKSVVEYAQPLLTIFKDFVRKLMENEHEELLRRVEEKAKGNMDLEKILARACEPKGSRKRKANSSGASGPKAKYLRTELLKTQK